MKKQIYVSLLIISICTFIISAGCGGGGNDGITQPGSISEGTDNDSAQDYGSLKITVRWPQSGIEGNCIFSSGEDNTLTASMPEDVVRIRFEVFEEQNHAHKLGESELVKPADAPESYAEIGNLPAIKVYIVAHLFKSNGQPFPITLDKVFQIKVGCNPLQWNMGNENLAVSANPPYITLSPPVSSSGIVDPTPVALSGETQISAHLTLESPDIPNQPPPTAIPGLSVEENTVESQGEWGLENYAIKFTIIGGVGELVPVGSTDPQPEVVSYTDDHGYANVFLRTDTAGKITLQAECVLDPSDPNSPVLVDTCEVEAVTSTSVEDAIYQMRLDYGYSESFIFHPEFESPDILDYPFGTSVTFTAVLEKINFDTGLAEPAPGMTIEWTVDGGSYYGSYNASGVTDQDGCAQATIDVAGYPAPSHDETITIEAKFTHPYKPDNVLTEDGSACVFSQTGNGDNFDEMYGAGTKAYNLIWWNTQQWTPSGPPYQGSGYEDYSYVDNSIPGGNDTPQSIRLYSPGSSDHAVLQRVTGAWYGLHNSNYKISHESRFYVRLDNSSLCTARVNIYGLYIRDVSSYGVVNLITFSNESGKIVDCTGEEITGLPYLTEKWYTVRVQVLASEGERSRGKINYWIGTDDNPGAFRKELILDEIVITSRGQVIGIEAIGGTVWFDEIDVFGLPCFSI